MIVFWASALVIFLVVEGITLGVTSIWFAIGSLCALIVAILSPDLVWLQFVWFAVISVVTLVFTRPLVKKYINGRTQATNADRVIGMRAVVREDIDNLAETGAVSVDGKLWTARNQGEGVIPAGATVVVRKIEGVKLMVESEQ